MGIHKFRKGNRVQFLEDDYGKLKHGKIYTVRRVWVDRESHLRFMSVYGVAGGWYPRQQRLIHP